MRIAVSSVHCWPDVRRGGERYAHELAAALARAGHRVTLLSTGAAPGSDTVLGVPVRRLPVRRLPRRGGWPEPWGDLAVEAAFGLQAGAHLGPAALAGRLDVWHATSTGDGAAAALAGLAARGVRTVFTDHGFPAARSRDARPDRRAHRTVVRSIDDYVCVSTAAAQFLQADYGRSAAVVPPGVRLAEHAPAARRNARPTVLYAGSLTEPRKGLPLLLAAVALLRKELPDVDLELLGPGDPAAVLAAAPAAGRAAVTTCRLVDDAELRERYARAWVTVLPSVAESFGMTLVESLASGTPVVALTDGGGPADVVRPEVGRLAARTPEALAAALAAAVELAERPGTAEACRGRAADFDWDAAVVPAFERIYAGGAA